MSGKGSVIIRLLKPAVNAKKCMDRNKTDSFTAMERLFWSRNLWALDGPQGHAPAVKRPNLFFSVSKMSGLQSLLSGSRPSPDMWPQREKITQPALMSGKKSLSPL